MGSTISRQKLKELYLPPSDQFVEVDVPRMPYFMVDGAGSPHEGPGAASLEWLFAAVYPVKREARKRMGKSFVEPPLEALWWADDPADFAAGRVERMSWTMMIPAPDWATEAVLAGAVAEAAERLGPAPDTLRLGSLEEGRCVQILHVGPPADEREKLERLHADYLPTHALAPNGPHHEIYLTDGRRTAPEKMRTVLRQPVRSCAKR